MINLKKIIKNNLYEIKSSIDTKTIFMLVLGTAIGSFGIYNIHQPTKITEGGIIGLLLFFKHWAGISSSFLSPILDITAYLLAYKYLGKKFMITSLISSLFMSIFFRIWELFPPILPNLSSQPLLAAVLGAIFIGVGAGLVVRQGGAGSGDDALALAISKSKGVRISTAYLLTDLSVLMISLSYIPLNRLVYSLITVTISSIIIDFVKTYRIVEKLEQYG